MDLTLLRQYLIRPESLFGGGHRQATKLESAMTRLQGSTNTELGELAEYLIHLGMVRARLARPTIYIQNIGSSGSHWLKSMLADCLGVLGGGEIYVAKPMLKFLQGLSPLQSRAVLQTIYIAHVYDQSERSCFASITNTAHIANLQQVASLDGKTIRMFLTRDPYDIVISRTFRKPEYREYLGMTDAPDSEYAKLNVDRVIRFYKTAFGQSHDMICRYEDLLVDPLPTIKDIAKLAQIDVTEERLTPVLDGYRADAVNESTAEKTKLSRQEREPVPYQIQDSVEQALSDIRKKLGYDS